MSAETSGLGVYDSETSLLVAVRDTLRICFKDMNEDSIQVEYDEMVPTWAGKRYIAVSPGGTMPGPVHGTGGGVRDELIAITVTPVLRMTEYPRDRRRDLFLFATTALNQMIEQIRDAIDWQWSVMEYANGLLDVPNTGQGFETALKWLGNETKPRVVGGEEFGEMGPSEAGMARSVYFGNASRRRVIPYLDSNNQVQVVSR